MDEKKIISRLRKNESTALAWIIDEYTPYLHAVVSSIMGGTGSSADIEEIVSESFIALWYNRQNIRPGKLKAYLAAVARNKTISRLRSLRIFEELDDDMAISECRQPEYELICAELSELALAAVTSLPEPDREIFKRHYFLYEKTESIARDLNINSATVRTKLARGRKRLKNYLTERGYSCENLLD